MALVLEADATSADAYVHKSLGSPAAPWYIQFDVYIPSATISNLTAGNDNSGDLFEIGLSGGFPDGIFLNGPPYKWAAEDDHPFNSYGSFVADVWHTVKYQYVSGSVTFIVDGTAFHTYTLTTALTQILAGSINGFTAIGTQLYYIRDVRVGTSDGATDIFSDDFSSGTLAAWDSTSGSVSVVSDPAVSGTAYTDSNTISTITTPSAVELYFEAFTDFDTVTTITQITSGELEYVHPTGYWGSFDNDNGVI